MGSIKNAGWRVFPTIALFLTMACAGRASTAAVPEGDEADSAIIDSMGTWPELAYVSEFPELVLRVPICDVVSWLSRDPSLGPTYPRDRLGIARLIVGTNGFVQSVSWISRPSGDTAPLESRLERRAFRPARRSDGSALVVPLAVQITRSPCDTLAGALDHECERRLGEARTLTARRFAHRREHGPYVLAKTDSADAATARRVAHQVLEWLRGGADDSHFDQPDDPWEMRLLLHMEFELAFDGPAGPVQILLAPGCEWLQARAGGRVRYVSVHGIRGRVIHDLIRAFPDLPGRPPRATG